MLQNTERAIKNEQSRETDKQDEEKQNIICIEHHDAQKNTNNVNMTTGDELNIIFMWKS